MDLAELERVLRDRSVSDRKFIKILFKYLAEWESRDRRSKTDISSTTSVAFKRHSAKMDRLRNRVTKERPRVLEMMRKHVLKLHADCCGPGHKK